MIKDAPATIPGIEEFCALPMAPEKEALPCREPGETFTDDWLILHVRREDIDNAWCGNVSRCAVARAVRRITGGNKVEVDGDTIQFEHRRMAYLYRMPQEGRDFILDFDECHKRAEKEALNDIWLNCERG
jgi:hypothetical protein